MSENEDYRTDDAQAPQANPGPRVDPVSADDDVQGRTNPGPRDVPGQDDGADDGLDRTEDPAGEKAIPGEHPKDDPDLEGEERFDAG
ncbi:hypothetical protein [Promicromonospora iranensis]|jgi:hypothetical protein|uniref:hypothetical protein n=1 Tax=Promicromonospora iranensis TaxID=1105144 RepID=UPI0023AA164A|nr:hypothetical protein [Promicromonospora iranensis]